MPICKYSENYPIETKLLEDIKILQKIINKIINTAKSR